MSQWEAFGVVVLLCVVAFAWDHLSRRIDQVAERLDRLENPPLDE